MKTYEAKVYVKNGNAKIPHTTQIQAESTFSAQQLISSQYGAENVITTPVEVTQNNSNNSAPWMKDF